jgi:PAS domain-containing protein
MPAPGTRSSDSATTMSDNFPPGVYGSMRVRLPLFALVAIGTVLIGIIPYPHHARREILIADLIFILLLTLAFLLPWERLPDWAWLILPVGYIGVIALIRNAQGNTDYGLVTVYLLPIIWLALYGRRVHIVLGLFFLDLALLIPVLVITRVNSVSEWRQVIIMGVVTTIVASTVSTMVNRDRAFVGNLARQTALAERNALDAGSARDRLETLLRAATGSAIMGVDPAGTVTFFSAGAEQMLGYSAAEVVGQHSIADFIDPAQIDERRHTIHALHLDTAAASGAAAAGVAGGAGAGGNSSTAGSTAGSNGTPPPLDPEVLAEVPWTATRKDGQKRRCVVRVRALPSEPATESGGGAVAAASGSGETINAGYVVVAIDVTEREELAAGRERLYTVQKEVTQSLVEQNNRLRELTQMKDDVVATVSHELRTPITSIRGFVELLLDESAQLGNAWPRTSWPIRVAGTDCGWPSPNSTCSRWPAMRWTPAKRRLARPT